MCKQNFELAIPWNADLIIEQYTLVDIQVHNYNIVEVKVNFPIPWNVWFDLGLRDNGWFNPLLLPAPA